MSVSCPSGRKRSPSALLKGLGFSLLLVAVAGCQRLQQPLPPAWDLRYEDLLIQGLLHSSGGEAEPAEHSCADERRFSQTVFPGDRLAAAIELGRRPKLVVAGCIGPPPGGARPEEVGRSTLELVVETANGRRSTDELLLPFHSRRWAHEIDLADFAGSAVQISFEARLPSSQGLYLRDVYVRHQRPRASTGGQRPPRQILLISVDTLREDAIGALGGPWPTPALDRFAASAEVWSPHYAAAAWTKPSHGSLLTGESPLAHGANLFDAPLGPGVVTLAERFGRAGFRTAGLVFDCLWLDPRFGFDRGFAEYRSTHWTLGQAGRQLVNWIAAHRGEPFFFFLHTFEPHSDFGRLPYEAPGVRPRGVEERFGARGYGCREGRCASGLLKALDDGTLAPLPQEQEILRFLYGEGVRHTDAQLGVLFADLEELGLFDDLMIVVTSDHGELLLEHGRTLHGSYWDEVLRVPLLVKWPDGQYAGRREIVTGALDVAPTLLAAAGLPHDGLRGSDLRRVEKRRAVIHWNGWGVVAQGPFKAVVWPQSDLRLLFDLESDPREQRDLAGEQPELMAGAERLLARWIAEEGVRRRDLHRRAEVDAPRLTPEEEERLRALGYVR
jgi:hypothetical protein